MKRLKKLALSILGVTVLSLGLYACSNDGDVQNDNTSNVQKRETLVDETQFAEVSKKIKVDTDWVKLNDNVVQMANILVNNNFQYDTVNYQGDDFFYKSLGKDGNQYKALYTESKELASKLRVKYFSKLECIDCVMIHKNLSDVELNSILYSSAIEVPKIDCNNWKFYACGVVAATTIEFPPAFAAALVLCISEYC